MADMLTGSMKMQVKEKGPLIIDYFDKVLVSYIAEGNDKGCRKCLTKRFLNTRKDRLYVKKNRYDSQSTPLYDNVINGMADKLKNDSELIDSKGRRKVYIFDKNSFTIEEDFFLPVPDCECCGKLEDDTEDNIIEMGENMLRDIDSEPQMPFRIEKKENLYKKLEQTILSKNVGIVTTLMDSTAGPLPLAVALLPVENGNDEPGSGRMSSIEESRAVAMLEAIERYAGFMPRGKKTKVYDSYNKLINTNAVLDIKKIILHEDSLTMNSIYQNDVFRFDYDQKYHWIYGYNITAKKAVLVPETLGYYGMKLKSDEYIQENFVYEISNGCSVGASLLESAYYGALEVIERDAFLSSWYMSRKIKRLVIDTFYFKGGDMLREEIEKFEKYYDDFQICFYDITNDVCIPTVLAAMYRKKTDVKKMNFMCAAAADIDIFEAVKKSLHELSSVYLGFQEKFESEYERLEYLTDDLSNVQDMLDHSLVYGYYKNLSHICFEENVIFEEKLSVYLNYEKYYLNTAYKKIIENLKRLNKEIIIVDQTTEEMRHMEMYCTKTIIPGLLPMTFNAKNARISRSRVNEIQKMQDEAIKVRFLPHPFP